MSKFPEHLKKFLGQKPPTVNDVIDQRMKAELSSGNYDKFNDLVKAKAKYSTEVGNNQFKQWLENAYPFCKVIVLCLLLFLFVVLTVYAGYLLIFDFETLRKLPQLAYLICSFLAYITGVGTSESFKKAFSPFKGNHQLPELTINPDNT